MGAGRRQIQLMRKYRVAVLNTHPIQYFAPLYAFANRAEDLELKVLFMSDYGLRVSVDPGFAQTVKWDLDLLSGYPSAFLGNRAKTRTPSGFFSIVAPEIWRELRSGRYDALLLHGHALAADWLAHAAAKLLGVPVLVRNDANARIALRGGVSGIARRQVLGAYYRSCDRALAAGSLNRAYYRSLGVDDDKIFFAPLCVDNQRFAAQSRLSSQTRAVVRRRFAIPTEAPAVLFAAKFTARKRPQDLLHAALMLQDLATPFTVVMCGAGELDADLRRFCAENGLSNVVFTGFVNQQSLPELYGACDVFVLPSEGEPWGLAVNEAMCAGLPVIVARDVGCVPDLVKDGGNGFAPPTGDIEALATAVRVLVENPQMRAAFGQESRRIIEHWGFREWVAGLRAALAGLPQARGRHDAASPLGAT